MKKILFCIVTISLLLLPLSSTFATEAILTSTGTLQWDPERAYNGYNVLVMNGDGYILDMEGRIVNVWDQPEGFRFGHYFFPMENGLWRMHFSTDYDPGRDGVLASGGGQGRTEHYNWEGERVWWWDAFNGIVDDGDGYYETDNMAATFSFHHDEQRIYNAALDEWTVMLLIWVAKGETDADNIGVDTTPLGFDFNNDDVIDAADNFGFRSRAPEDDPETLDVDESLGATWSPCGLIEIRPLYDVTDNTPLINNSAEILWYWTFSDHMVTTDPGGTALATEWTDWSGRISAPAKVVSTTDGDTDSIRANPQLLDMHAVHNDALDGPRKDMQHCNSFDYDEATGYVVINAKASNEIFVLDHDGTFVADAAPGTFANNWDTNEVGALARTSAGDFLYRFGAPYNYYSGDAPGYRDHGHAEFYGCHDIQWILPSMWRPPMAPGDDWAAPGEEYALPGAGNFLIFDNSCYNPFIREGSWIVEWNPYIMGFDPEGEPILQTETYADGNVMYVDASPYGINSVGLGRRDQVVFDYNKGVEDFYGNHISGTSRMPNGNTIITAGTQGHLFEINADKDVVWEFVTPRYSGGIFPKTQTRAVSVFRNHRFTADHPAFVGQDLTAGDLINESNPTAPERAEDALRLFRQGAMLTQ